MNSGRQVFLVLIQTVSWRGETLPTPFAIMSKMHLKMHLQDFTASLPLWRGNPSSCLITFSPPATAHTLCSLFTNTSNSNDFNIWRCVWCKFQCFREERDNVEDAVQPVAATVTCRVTRLNHRWSAAHGDRTTVRHDIASPLSFLTATVNIIFAYSCVTCIRFYSASCSTIPSTLSNRSPASSL